MTYQELPLSTKIKIKMICNRNNITKPSDIETAYNNYVEGRDIFEGLSEDYQRVSAFDNYLANGGHIYSGEDEDAQQMQKAEPNIFQRPDGSYFYQVPGGEEIDVTPINTLSEDNSRWTYTDASGRVYNPAQPLQSNYSLTEAENANAVERAINNYTRELAWREANDPSSIALQGKYVLPTIGMSSLAASPATLPYLNTALASGFGAHGIQDLANGNADWQTALEVAPLASLAKPMAEAAVPALEWAANGLERNVGLGRNAAGDWNGWIRVGNTEFRPSRTSANMGLKVDTRPAENSSISSAQLLYKLQRGKISKAELSKLVTEKEADWAIKNVNNREQVNKLNAILDKAAKGMKGKKGANDSIIMAENVIKARTPEGRLQLIRDKYKSEIEKSKEATGIDWSDQNSVMASMPDELKLSAVGFDENTPFLERYYNNVSKVIGKGGIQERLLKSKELRRNAKGQWEGEFGKEYRLVEPTEYIKMRIANDKGYNFDLVGREPGYTYYPMHGTLTKDYKYLTRPSSSPGKDGYWTGIQDKESGSRKALEYYQGKGASVPFFRMPDYELPIMTPNGMGSSNSYGGTGQSLLDMLRNNPGKIQRPTFVSDPQTGGIPFNEYNFGPNVPNPKSMWNTLDFEPNAGPLAYNSRDLENNLV